MQIGQDGSLVLRCMEYTDVETMLCWLQDERVLKDYEGRDQHFDRAQVEEKFFSRTAQEDARQQAPRETPPPAPPPQENARRRGRKKYRKTVDKRAPA